MVEYRTSTAKPVLDDIDTTWPYDKQTVNMIRDRGFYTWLQSENELTQRRNKTAGIPDTLQTTLVFPTASSIIIWKTEVLPQMSDGMWENDYRMQKRRWYGARPSWRYWHSCMCELAPNKIDVKGYIPGDSVYAAGVTVLARDPGQAGRMIRTVREAGYTNYNMRDLRKDLKAIRAIEASATRTGV